MEGRYNGVFDFTKLFPAEAFSNLGLIFRKDELITRYYTTGKITQTICEAILGAHLQYKKRKYPKTYLYNDERQ